MEGDRRRQSCMFKDLHEAVQHLKCACMCTYDPPFICRASLPSCFARRAAAEVFLLLRSPCFFDSFLEVTEVGAASFHLPQTETCSEKRKKKLRELNRGKDIQVKTEGSCKKVKEKEAREKASDNTRRFPSRSLTASTALSATLMPHAPPHALCEADLGATTPPVATDGTANCFLATG